MTWVPHTGSRTSFTDVDGAACGAARRADDDSREDRAQRTHDQEREQREKKDPRSLAAGTGTRAAVARTRLIALEPLVGRLRLRRVGRNFHQLLPDGGRAGEIVLSLPQHDALAEQRTRMIRLQLQRVLELCRGPARRLGR